MSDEVISCADCRSEFTFTESEATFFASKGLTKPRRCKACRQKRRDAKPRDAGVSPGPTLVTPSRSRTQWVGGGELEELPKPRRNRKDRRRDRSDDHGF